VAVRVDGFWAFALPTTFGALALGLLVYDHFRALNTLALVLSGAAVAAVIVRMVLTFRRNAHLLETSRRDAETDELTGLANRRLLLHDLESRIEAGVPTLLLMFDLDGFKSYNASSPGIAAAPAALRWPPSRTARAAWERDEFASLRRRQSRPRPITSAASGRFATRATAFRSAPRTARRVAGTRRMSFEALRIADTRLYGNKDSRASSAGRQTCEVQHVRRARDAASVAPSAPGRWARRSVA
jgi:hypothetical protein